jgi:hypothetical protein
MKISNDPAGLSGQMNGCRIPTVNIRLANESVNIIPSIGWRRGPQRM